MFSSWTDINSAHVFNNNDNDNHVTCIIIAEMTMVPCSTEDDARQRDD